MFWHTSDNKQLQNKEKKTLPDQQMFGEHMFIQSVSAHFLQNIWNNREFTY